jgi:hypothetical protein
LTKLAVVHGRLPCTVMQLHLREELSLARVDRLAQRLVEILKKSEAWVYLLYKAL